MKIVFLTSTATSCGGMERVLYQRVKYMVEHFGYDITIISTENNPENRCHGGEPFFNYDPKVKIIDLGINYDNLNFPENKECYLKKRLRVKEKRALHLERLNKAINEIKPDIIASFGEESRHVACKIDYKCKKILEHHMNKASFVTGNKKASFLEKLKRIVRYYREKSFIDKYDRFMVLTEEDKNDWNDPRIIVIPNCLPFFPKESAKCENKKIVTVGRLVDQKGYDILLDVWKILAPKYPNWTLEVYGEGEKRKELEEKEIL